MVERASTVPQADESRKTRRGPTIGLGTVWVVVDVSGDLEILGRVSDRLRGSSEGSLTRAREELDRASIAVAVHQICAWAADRQGAPASVPVLHPLASGDQLAVVGREFLVWIEATSDADALERWRSDIGRLRSAV